MGDFFLKKLCMAQQTFLGKFMGGGEMFYMGTKVLMIRSYRGKRVSQMHFPVI